MNPFVSRKKLVASYFPLLYSSRNSQTEKKNSCRKAKVSSSSFCLWRSPDHGTVEVVVVGVVVVVGTIFNFDFFSR